MGNSNGRSGSDTRQENKALELKGVLRLNRELGRGSYGRVTAVKYHGKEYAAKEVHSILIESIDPEGKESVKDDFLHECEMCRSLNHPNIVGFIGIYYPNRNSLPLMIMELMVTNLTKYVEGQDISTKTKISILHDVCSGLSYLHNHTPPIIHRDLSPNNVLLSGEPVAKIGDLGVAKMIKADSKVTKSKLTTAPGTVHFMPPESFSDNPVYFTSLDVFSFGGITLHVVAQEWPTPTSATKFDKETREMKGFTEVQCREKYLNMIIGRVATLKPLVISCLDNDPTKRPTIKTVLTRLESISQQLNQSPNYLPAQQNMPHCSKAGTLKLEVGDTFQCGNPPINGIIKWIGHLPGATDQIAGVEMEIDISGATDGWHDGCQYFYPKCNRGIFLRLGALRCAEYDQQFQNPLQHHYYEHDSRTAQFVQAPTELDVKIHTGVKGIQGHKNSCYLDATLYGMFAFSDVFDGLFLEKKSEDPFEIKIKTILERKIVNPLRIKGVVVQDAVLELQKVLSTLQQMKGLTSDEQDPEGFLNLLFKHALHEDPFLFINQPSGTDKKFFVKLFVEADQSVLIPETQWLIHKMFKEQKITFKKYPQKLLIQIPPYGKQHKVFGRVKPTVKLVLDTLCDGYAEPCFVSGKLSCDECSQLTYLKNENGLYFCKNCSRLWHARPGIQYHKPVPQDGGNPEGLELELLSVLCIETSHYVCFSRITGSGKDQWVFFDSKATRPDDVHFLPHVTNCTTELNEWVYGNKDIASYTSKELPTLVRRFVEDAYLYIYVDRDGIMYGDDS